MDDRNQGIFPISEKGQRRPPPLPSICAPDSSEVKESISVMLVKER